MNHLLLSNQERIHYQELNTQFKNKAPSLLFIHGNFSSLIWWQDTIQAIATWKRHIIALDLRGFGKSTYKHKCRKFQDWAQDINQFCALKEVSRLIAIGWSFGGGISMKLAEISPNLVEKIILTCSVSYTGIHLLTDGLKCMTDEAIKTNKRAEFVIKVHKQKNMEAMAGIYEVMLFTKTPDYPQQKKKDLINSAFEQTCYEDVLFALANSDIHPEKIKAQVLIIHGRYDQVVPLNFAEENAVFFKSLEVWDENAHMIPIENTPRYVSRIKSFIENSNL